MLASRRGFVRIFGLCATREQSDCLLAELAVLPNSHLASESLAVNTSLSRAGSTLAALGHAYAIAVRRSDAAQVLQTLWPRAAAITLFPSDLLDAGDSFMVSTVSFRSTP